MSNPLEGRNTIVYGAGGGIGGAVARAFARDGATAGAGGCGGDDRGHGRAAARTQPGRRGRGGRLPGLRPGRGYHRDDDQRDLRSRARVTATRSSRSPNTDRGDRTV